MRYLRVQGWAKAFAPAVLWVCSHTAHMSWIPSTV